MTNFDAAKIIRESDVLNRTMGEGSATNQALDMADEYLCNAVLKKDIIGLCEYLLNTGRGKKKSLEWLKTMMKKKDFVYEDMEK